ncbi:FAD-dependent oxidoreductase [Actinomadura violacea]|uniref:FAD-dependent oxidoreductase n=1 Tax=Actinomadura violacea TaxID=2819934 RepID=A0ABS3RMU2_9ACTN|nr:FAD-dependent oxidoreductase [Actinomadura violacea]MBO2458070.1 FAD-dependent oxidoreductase [Actinomadura violacea]
MSEELPGRTDVLVVGAGPVGLTLATALVRAGVEVVLIDKAPAAATTSRAAVVHARTLEVLRAMDVTDGLVEQGVAVSRYTVREHDRPLLRIDFGSLPTDYPFALTVPQTVTEQVLRDRLRSSGGRVLWACELAHIAQDEDEVVAGTADGRTIRARYAVGADGMHSLVRDRAGIAFTGDTAAESFVLADVHMNWAEAEAGDEQNLFLSAAGTVLVVPLPGGRHRVAAAAEGMPAAPDLGHVQALLRERGPRAHPATVKDVVWSSRFRVHHRLADHYRAGRLLLAGDAAHVHSPAGGQGMNTGIQDAMDLAGRLTAVIRDGADDTVLDGYEAERRPVAEHVISFTRRMTHLATVNSAPLRGLRNTALHALGRFPAARRSIAMSLSELAADPVRPRR